MDCKQLCVIAEMASYQVIQAEYTGRIYCIIQAEYTGSIYCVIQAEYTGSIYCVIQAEYAGSTFLLFDSLSHAYTQGQGSRVYDG